MPDWYALWRWYVASTVWVCSCGCIGPDCCGTCCEWTPNIDPRVATIIERAAQIGVVL